VPLTPRRDRAISRLALNPRDSQPAIERRMRSPGIESLNDTTQGRKVSLIVRVIRWIPPIICERAELRALRGSRRKNRFQLCSRFSSYLMVLLRTSWPVCIQYSSFDYYHYHYHYSSACRMPSKVGTIWPRAVPGKRSLRSIDRSIAICELIEERERERGERERGGDLRIFGNIRHRGIV
jgi:hypothetical protein